MATINHSIKNGLVISLAIIFLASSLGIAKVSHYCRMAQASVTSDCCEAKEPKDSCCNPESEKRDDCCTNQVQFFKADYKSSAPSFQNLKIKAVNNETVFGMLVKVAFHTTGFGIVKHWPQDTVWPPGLAAHLLYSVFLI